MSLASWGPPGGHLGAFLGRLGGLLGRFGALLGRLWAVLGASWAVLGPPWGPLGLSWSVGKPKRGELPNPSKTIEQLRNIVFGGPVGERLGALLGRLGGLLGRLRAILGRLGAHLVRLAPSWTVLAAPCGPLGQSWSPLGSEKVTRHDAGEPRRHSASPGILGSGPLNPLSLRAEG